MGPTADTHSLNARLLRFRSQPGREDALALARDLMAAKRYGDARGVAIAAQGDDADGELLVIEGRAWYEERDLVRAQAALLKAAKVAPRAAEAFRWLGEVLLKRGDPQRAVRALNRALDLKPDFTEAQTLARRAEQLARVAASVPPQEPQPAPQADSGQAATGAMSAGARAETVQMPVRVGASASTTSSPGSAGAPEPLRAPPPATSAPPAAFAPPPATSAPPAAFAPPPATSAPPAAFAPPPPPASSAKPPRPIKPPPALQGVSGQPSPFPKSTPPPPAQPLLRPEDEDDGDEPTQSFRTGPGTTASPAADRPFEDLSSGDLDARWESSEAGAQSAPGTVTAAGSTSAAGTHSSPGVTSASGRIQSPHESTAGYLSSPGAQPAPTSDDIGVDLNGVDLNALPGDTTPGVGESPGGFREDSNPGWDDSSPSLDLGPGGVSSLASTGDGSLDAADLEPAPNLPLGSTSGYPDDPDRVLGELADKGIFEPDEGESEADAVWAAPQDVARGGSGMRGAVIGVWILTLALFGGGYYGWQQWVGKRHAESAQLVQQAREAALDSDHARLVEAERLLRLAREKHARSSEVPRYELFVHTQRVLENGSRELSSLRSAIARAERLGEGGGYKDAARAVLAAYSGGGKQAEPLIAAALKSAGGQGELLYVVGRLEQRLGMPGAAEHLTAAAAAAPDLRATAIALGEIAHTQGAPSEAMGHFEGVLKKAPDHLRAKLWRGFLSADVQQPAEGLSALDADAKRAGAAAPIDRVLFSLSRARLLTRQGELESAGQAVADALSTGANEPRLLAMVAEEARRTGKLSMAQAAATRAVTAAPGSLAYRLLLARVMIQRGDGGRAVELLDKLPADEPAVLMMRARAALQSGSAEALESGLSAVEAYPEDGEAKLSMDALSLRLKARMGATPKLLRRAKRLSRRAPGDPDVARALGEVALELGEAGDATRALEQLVVSAPNDADGHSMLGRARRMGSDTAGAEQAFRRALELSPTHREAMVGLGSLLLDSGKYTEADDLYQKLVSSGSDALFGRLGRVEALIGLGKLDDAGVQLAGLPENLRDGRAARETGARLALARRKPGQALTLLRPLTEGEQVRPSTLALYGDALYAADQVNSAAGVYDSALEKDATLPEALIGRARVHLRAERPGDALELLDEAQKALKRRLRGPDVHVQLLTHQGHAYVQREKGGDLDRARRALLKAIDLPNVPAEAHFWLGEASGGRRTPEAAAAFKRYLELDPRGRYVDRAKRALGPML